MSDQDTPQSLSNPEPDADNEPLTPELSQQIEARLIAYVEARFHRGPLPAPEDIAKYNESIPDGGNRLMNQVELQSEHRRNIETIAVKGEIVRSNWGLAAGTFVSTLTVSGGIWLISGGHDVAGVSLVGGTLATIVGTLVGVRYNRKKELDDKNK